MAEDAEKSILLSRFPPFEGEEGDEREWHNLARAIFEKEVRDWPIDQIRLFKNSVPKMIRGTGTTTRNRYHHKLTVAFKARPSWALSCCLKIMFGGWDALEPTAVGILMKRAFPGHNCGTWACPEVPVFDPHDDTDVEDPPIGNLKKRAVTASATGRRRGRQSITANKRRKTTSKVDQGEEATVPSGQSTKVLTTSEALQRDEGSHDAIRKLRDAPGYVDAARVIKPEPLGSISLTKLPASPRPAEDDQKKDFNHLTDSAPSNTGPSESDRENGQAAGAPGTDCEAQDAMLLRTSSDTLHTSTQLRKRGRKSSKNILLSIEAPQTTIDAVQQQQSLFSHIREEVKRLQAVNQLQLITRDNYVSHVARLQDECIVVLQSQLDELERLVE